MVFAINAAGAARRASRCRSPASTQSYAGAPVDNKQYGEARKALMQQIAQRQQELAEEQKKQQAAGQQALRQPPPGALRAEEMSRHSASASCSKAARISGRPSCLRRAQARQCGCCRNSGR